MPDAWRSLCDQLASAGEIVGDDPGALRYLTHLLTSGLDLFVHNADPACPEVSRPQDPDKRWGMDCPDALYGRAPIDGVGTYRVTGGPGDAHYLGITVTAGHLGTVGIRTIGSLSRPGELECSADGSFELWVSPEPHLGNWIQTEPDAEAIAIRQFLNDWDRETASWITIERLDPVPSTVDPAAQLEALASFVTGSVRMWEDYVAGLRERSFQTILAPNPPSSRYGATPDNVYGSGYFELGEDEAVIVSVAPPPCHYWMFSLGNRWFESLDYTYRQTSLNGAQAVVVDGVFHGVISHRDPGVANWLDACGSPVTPVAYRYQLPAVGFEALPRPSTRVVPFAELSSELHADTPMVTPVERADALARRRRAVLRRYGR